MVTEHRNHNRVSRTTRQRHINAIHSDSDRITSVPLCRGKACSTDVLDQTEPRQMGHSEIGRRDGQTEEREASGRDPRQTSKRESVAVERFDAIVQQTITDKSQKTRRLRKLKPKSIAGLDIDIGEHSAQAPAYDPLRRTGPPKQ
jgi:hypothetical protein